MLEATKSGSLDVTRGVLQKAAQWELEDEILFISTSLEGDQTT